MPRNWQNFRKKEMDEIPLHVAVLMVDSYSLQHSRYGISLGAFISFINSNHIHIRTAMELVRKKCFQNGVMSTFMGTVISSNDNCYRDKTRYMSINRLIPVYP